MIKYLSILEILTLSLYTMRRFFSYTGLFSFLLFLLLSCGEDELPVADLVLSGGNVYTVDEANPTATAIGVKDGKIIFVGDESGVAAYIGEETKVVDLAGKTITPGLIESHGHLMGLGWAEMNLDLSGIKNYDEMVELVAEAVAEAEPGEWILGRGWHQSKWDEAPEKEVQGFQTHDRLSAVSPNNPVFLTHTSGHASFANAKAMEIAGVNQMSIESLASDLEGGEIVRDANGNPTGIFSENAEELIWKYVPVSENERLQKSLNLAIQACQRNGITSFHDAGATQAEIDLYKDFKQRGMLGVRVYAMVSGPDRELTAQWLERGPLIDSTDHLLTVRSIKLNCDGALGNRGAWLLEEYTDMPGEFGLETLPMEYVLEISNAGLDKGFQVNAHAIGDGANREVLDQFESALTDHPEATDHRFRIEHAQHLHPDDIPRFGEMNVIAAVQAVHLSSDRPWAIDRLGEQRIVEGAYVWQKLL
jgi:predicted amidohydrolase YtcJ